VAAGARSAPSTSPPASRTRSRATRAIAGSGASASSTSGTAMTRIIAAAAGPEFTKT